MLSELDLQWKAAVSAAASIHGAPLGCAHASNLRSGRHSRPWFQHDRSTNRAGEAARGARRSPARAFVAPKSERPACLCEIAGAGVEANSTDGLSRFKKGWSTGTRTVYFCGRIFNHTKYSEIVRAKGISVSNYFPAYRRGEFR